MRFHSLRIDNFRCLVETVEIADIDAELTVIAGDNEEGKSTLLQAIQTVLFDRYKLGGAAADALQPKGYQVAPSITVDFSINTERYRLYKQFCQKPTARLTQADGTVLQDDAAEAALEQLLGFSRPGRGASKPENRGVWGLLWIQQGQMFQSVAPADEARQSLHRALEQEVGDVLGGAQGQALLERLQQARARYWSATGKPSGEYRDCIKRVQTLATELAELERQLAEYDDKVDQLTKLTAKRKQYDHDDTLADLSRRVEAADAQADHVTALRHAIDIAEGEAKLASAQADHLHGSWDARQKAAKKLDLSRAAISELEQLSQTRDARREQAEAAVTAARAALNAADDAASQAQKHYEELQQASLRQEQSRRLGTLKQQLTDARRSQTTINTANTAIQQNKVDKKALTEIRASARRVDQLQAQLQAGATEVIFDVSVAVQAQGRCEPRDGRYLVTGQANFTLDGVGRIDIAAGGADLPDLEHELQSARQQLADALRGCGAENADDAERLAAERNRHQETAATEKKLLAVYAPDGVDALAGEVDSLQAAVAKDKTAKDKTAKEAVTEAVEDSKSAVEKARRETRKHNKARDAAHSALERAKEAAEQARHETTQTNSELANERKNHQQVRNQLDDERRQQDDDALYRAASEARLQQQAAADQLATRKTELTALDPEMVAVRAKRAHKALATVQDDMQALDRQIASLRAELRAIGHQGLGEAAESLRAEHEAAERRRLALDLEANALRVAHDTLAAAARDARQIFLAPIAERVQVYLRGLFPEAELLLDDELRLAGLRRGNRTEDFESLSVGTREQLAVITRFAFADLLAEQGQELPIILDDALVYSDDRRMAGMLDVIARAAERHQVIVLTCHERAYRSLGGSLRRLGR